MDLKKLDHILNLMEENGTLVHAERVAMLSYATAKEFNMYPDELETVYLAGLLHEIGKMGLPENLRQHGVKIDEIYPYVTVSMLKMIDGFEGLSEAILHHTENVDGSGYPLGITNDEINILSKIVKIADFYDHCRLSGMTHDETTKKIREQSDIMFVKKLITPFLKTIIDNDFLEEYN